MTYFRKCSSRKNPYPPHGRSLEIPKGRGVLKGKILEAKYGAKLEFPEGREEAKQKTFHWGVSIIYKFYLFTVKTFTKEMITSSLALFLFQKDFCWMVSEVFLPWCVKKITTDGTSGLEICLKY